MIGYWNARISLAFLIPTFSFPMTEQILLFLASYIANTMAAFAGGGAGLVQLPALLLLGLPFPIALATHKMATVTLGLGAAYRFSKEEDLIEVKFALILISFGVIGTILGAYVITHIPSDLAKMLLGIIIIALGIYSVLKKELGQNYSPQNRDLRGILIGGLALFLIGIFNGSFTAGSGLFLTLVLILWYGLDYKRAVAYTMALCGVFWNAAGAAALMSFGEPIYWPWLPVLLIASFVGGYTGAHFNTLKGNTWIKYAFTAITLMSGVSLLV